MYNRLAIVGSTIFDNEDEIVRKNILEAIYFLSPFMIISGGADGVDTIAANIAKNIKLELKKTSSQK